MDTSGSVDHEEGRDMLPPYLLSDSDGSTSFTYIYIYVFLLYKCVAYPYANNLC